MVIFLAGAHGVGKTFLGGPTADRLGIRYATASALIHDELGTSNWDAGKRVLDSDRNQEALISAVNRIVSVGKALILDGHFVLRGHDGHLIKLPASVFQRLKVSTVVLLEAPLEIVAERIKERTGTTPSMRDIAEICDAERTHAVSTCKKLNINLHRLLSPDMDTLQDAIYCALNR